MDYTILGDALCILFTTTHQANVVIELQTHLAETFVFNVVQNVKLPFLFNFDHSLMASTHVVKVIGNQYK